MELRWGLSYGVGVSDPCIGVEIRDPCIGVEICS